jgi:hypothetical protein
LPADYDIYWILKDSLGKKYQHKVPTNEQGYLIIDTAMLPAGLLSAYRAAFELQLKNGSDYQQPVTFIFGDTQYECVFIKFTDIDYVEGDGSSLNVVEFKTPFVPGDDTPPAGAPIIVPFINQTTVVYQHNLGRFVSVHAFELNGNEIDADVDNTDANTVTVSFNTPYTGRLLIY